MENYPRQHIHVHCLLIVHCLSREPQQKFGKDLLAAHDLRADVYLTLPRLRTHQSKEMLRSADRTLGRFSTEESNAEMLKGNRTRISF